MTAARHAHRRLHAVQPAAQDRLAQRGVPARHQQLVKPLVPEKTAGEVGAPGDAGEQEARSRVALATVGISLDGVAVEVGNAREKVAEAGTGDTLPVGGVGGHGENLVEFGLEVLTARGEEGREFRVGRARSRGSCGCRLSEEGVFEFPPKRRRFVEGIHGDGESEGKREHALHGNEVGVTLHGVGQERLEGHGELALRDGGQRRAGVAVGEMDGGGGLLLVGVEAVAPVVVGGGDAVLEGVLDVSREREGGESNMGNRQLSWGFIFLPNQKEFWRMVSSLEGGE